MARPQAGRGREPLSPGRYTVRENEKRECPPGTPSCLLIKADRPASQTAGGSPPPPLGKVHFVGNFQLSRGDNTGALPLYPAVSHQSGLKV